MESVDDYIKSDIEKFLRLKSIPWINPIVKIRQKEVNPYLHEDHADINTSPNVIESEVGQLFCTNGCEMEISFPSEYNHQSDTSFSDFYKSNAETLRGIAKSFNRSSIAHLQDINDTYSCSTKHNLSESLEGSDRGAEYTRFHTIALRNFLMGQNVKMIEPILCTLFLYNDKHRQVASDYWNLVPAPSIPLFDCNNIETKSVDTATFLIDSKTTEGNYYFILLFSHPTIEDNSSAILKYFLNPNLSNEQAAVKKLHNTFPRISTAFSTFAISFIPYTSISFEMPPPYLLEGPLPSKGIHEFITETYKKSKQLPISVLFSVQEQQCNYFIRRISLHRTLPYLAPVHHLLIRIESLSMRLMQSHNSNIVISVSVIDKDKKTELDCVSSKLKTEQFIKETFSRCVYHSKNPEFDDQFLIKLPEPIPPSISLQFKVYHAHIKNSQKTLSLVGSAITPLFVNDHGLFMNDGQHSVKLFLEGQSKSTPDKSTKITFWSFLRSNLVSNDAQFLIFAKKKGKLMPVLSNLNEQVIVANLMFILSKILTSYRYEKEISFLPLTLIRDRALKLLAPPKFLKYLNIFVRYFAFRNLTPQRIVEGECKLSDVSGELKTSTSLFDFSQLDLTNTFNSCGPMSPTKLAEDISLIDFSDSVTSKIDQLPMHIKLVTCFAKVIEKNGLNYLDFLIDFIFELLIKSMVMKAKVEYTKEYHRFIKVYISSIQADIGNVQKYSKSIALFANLLFDIGLASISSKITKSFIKEFTKTPQTYPGLINYINFAYRPSLFYFSMKYIEEFRKSTIYLIECAFHKEGLYDVFGIILQIFSCYDMGMSQDIASILIVCIKSIKLNQMPATNKIVTHIAFLNFLLQYASCDSLKQFATDESVDCLFSMAHFILTRITPKEISYACSVKHKKLAFEETDMHAPKNESPKPPIARARRCTVKEKRIPAPPNIVKPRNTKSTPSVNDIMTLTKDSLISFANKFISVSNINGGYKLLNLCYHMMKNKGMDNRYLKNLFELLSIVIGTFSPHIYRSTKPCIVKILKAIFIFVLDQREQIHLLKPIKALFDSDLKTSGTTDIADMFATRALSLLTAKEITSPIISAFMNDFNMYEHTKHFFATFQNLQAVANQITEKAISNELKINYLFYRFICLTDSPDAQFETLQSLYQEHEKYKNYPEMINTIIVQAALVIEILTQSGRMPNYFNVAHPVLLFDDVSSIAQQIMPHKCFDLPTYADSPSFNENSIIQLIWKAMTLCNEGKVYGKAIHLIDYIWPLLEHRRLYSELDSLFQSMAQLSQNANDTPNVSHPFFKVSFFGSVFDKEDGKTFIYRANKLTTLFEFSDVIINKYKSMSSLAKIELIADSDIVDVNSLDPNNNYIQVTFVEPYKPYNLMCFDAFYFDRPFVPGEKKKQGNITTQWIARTIMKTKFFLPFVMVRSIVDGVETKEYEPLINAYRQIRKRTETMSTAIKARDYRQVQQLLHGSLIVTVNEGPEKIAEAFKDVSIEFKAKKRLQEEFFKLLEILKVALDFHGEWVTWNPEFVPLQVQLEDSYVDFSSKILKIFDCTEES